MDSYGEGETIVNRICETGACRRGGTRSPQARPSRIASPPRTARCKNEAKPTTGRRTLHLQKRKPRLHTTAYTAEQHTHMERLKTNASWVMARALGAGRVVPAPTLHGVLFSSSARAAGLATTF